MYSRFLLLTVLLTGCSGSRSGDTLEDAFKFPEVSLAEDPSTVSVIPEPLLWMIRRLPTPWQSWSGKRI